MNKQQEQLFLQLIEENQARIYRICSVYAHTKEDKKDLVQEVFLQIWKALPSFKGNANINSWLYRITLNVCLRANFLKKKNPSVPLESIEWERIAVPNENKKERYEQLYHCISLLKPLDKSIIILFLEDLAYKEISGIVGISENYVAVKIKRIKKQLLQCLQQTV